MGSAFALPWSNKKKTSKKEPTENYYTLYNYKYDHLGKGWGYVLGATEMSLRPLNNHIDRAHF